MTASPASATRTERADEAARERACRGVRRGDAPRLEKMMSVFRNSVRPAGRLGVACALATVLGGLVLTAAPGPARLLGVSAQESGRNAALLIESSEPVAYAVSRPDPLTLFVDLRNVEAGDAAATVARTGPVADVKVERETSIDGKALARVRVALTSPATYQVHSARNVIRLDLAPAADDVPLETAPAVGAAPGALATTDARADTSAIRDATSIQKIHASYTRTSTTITLSGDGRLNPGALSETDDAPRRLVMDFPNVSFTAPAQTGVQGVFVKKVRVATHSRDPLVTRVVLEISPSAVYHVERTGADGRDLALVFEGQKSGGTIMVAPPETRTSTTPDDTSDDTMTLAQAEANIAAITPPDQDPIAALDSKAEPKKVSAPKTKSSAKAQPPAAEPQPPAQTQPPSTSSGQAQTQPPQNPPAAQPTLNQVVPGTAEKKYTGAPISMDFEDTDLRSVLRVFSETSGLNIIIDPAVQGRVNMVLNEVPWDQAMETILRANQLTYMVDGTIVRILPLSVYKQEQEQQAEISKAKALAGELHVQTFALSYAKADALKPLLTSSALSTRGEVQTDVRTNTLIVKDLPDRLQQAAALISTLDKPEPQVEVEARIVQTTRDFARAIGVQWGFNGRANQQIGNTTGLAFPNNGSIGGRVGTQGPVDPNNTGTSNNVGTAVNLAAPGAVNAVGLALGSINGAFNLDVALTALENTGKGRILSTPRLTTQNNQTAEVAQGVQIPIQTVANNTVAVSFKDATLKLQVTPQITTANTVIMNITLENATPDFSRQVNGIPPIDTQRALTTVQVNDGATTVIGGIFTSREDVTNDRTPVLHRVPILKWLFQRNTLTDSSRELLIFITPRILRG
jgi:type IV pilus assembly protein PilQ